MQTLKTPSVEGAWLQCPVCGKALPYEPSIPRYDAPCSGCGCLVWCRRRVSNGETILEVLPDRLPEPWEVEQVADALVREAAARFVVDLHRLDSLESAFVARLVSLNKRVRSAGKQLVLRGLSPVVREMFGHLRLDKAFDISDGD